MAFTAADVKTLREMTGVGMLDCKKALVDTDGDMEKAMKELTDIIGTGLACAEAVPSAFGLMVAAKGDACEAVYGGVNIGNDTDTVATIVGSMVGTLKGAGAYPERYLETIDRVNGYDLRAIAREFDALS